MKTKTASVRLPKEMFEEIDNICDDVGCSRNEWIKDKLREGIREETNENSQDQENSQGESPRPTARWILESENKPKTFTCDNGYLYENGSLFGSCSNYDLNDGKVYEKNGKYLGPIQN